MSKIKKTVYLPENLLNTLEESFPNKKVADIIVELLYLSIDTLEETKNNISKKERDLDLNVKYIKNQMQILLHMVSDLVDEEKELNPYYTNKKYHQAKQILNDDKQKQRDKMK